MQGNLFEFRGGAHGAWRVVSQTTLVGVALPKVAALDMVSAGSPQSEAVWTLRGFTSNARYVTRRERDALETTQQDLGRPQARRAALIPLTKAPAWWALAQDERRAIFEETSQHNAIGLAYLPAIARRLHHARDIGEPFDFLTWFEYAPEHEADFDRLVARLRATREWTYVMREIDIRLERAA